MTGRRYYLATLAAWQRHTHRLAGSHFILLDDAPASAPDDSSPPAQPALAAKSTQVTDAVGENPAIVTAAAEANCCPPPRSRDAQSTRILVLVEGDEGAHLALDDDPAFEALPHPLAQKPISLTAQAALAPHGVADGATTFDAAEALARVHPLLRHTVF